MFLSNDAANNIDGIRIAEINKDLYTFRFYFFYVSAKTTSPLNAKFTAYRGGLTAYRGGPVERNFL